jgi:MoxR-like ATPase
MDTIVSELQAVHSIIGRKQELSASLIAANAGKHILLEGAVGVGKTTIALAIASHLERSFLRIDGDERYTEQKLAGWFDPPLVLSRGYTKESFIPGPLALAMEEGTILFINELNRMPEGTQNVLLSAMDEKTIHIPKYGRVDARQGFMIIATQNPDEYIGTSQLSEALKDRFICVHLSYQSEDEEKQIVRLRSHCRDEDVIDISVFFTRLTRSDDEVRRGASVRGAIDMADLFFTAHGGFDDDVEKWTACGKLALLTKIELHDYTAERFDRLIHRLAEKALALHDERNASRGSHSRPRKPEIDLSALDEHEKKK